MKKNIVKLSMLLVLVALLASMFSISALAAPADGGSDEGVLGIVGDAYGWFEKTFEPAFTYVRAAIPELEKIEEPIVHYAILAVILLITLFVVIRIILALFKGRFFRALARLVMWSTIIWFGLFVSIYVRSASQIGWENMNTPELFCVLFSLEMAFVMPKAAELAADLLEKLPFGNEYWVLPAAVLGTALLIFIICCIVISCSKKRARRKAAKKLADAAEAEAVASVEETAPVEEAEASVEASTEEAEAPAEEAHAEETAEESAPVEEAEAEAVASVEETAPVEEAEAAAEETAEETAPAAEAETEDAPAEAEALPESDAVALSAPVVMPIPSSVFDTVDFTDAKRDGFALAPSVTPMDAELALSDALAEELTATVYDGVKGGKTAVVSLEVLSESFKPYAYVNVKILRRLGMIADDVTSISVVERGVIDKPLMVEAAEISLSAVKMITLAGGRVIRLA